MRPTGPNYSATGNLAIKKLKNFKDFRKLSVYYHNVGGLRSKISDIAIKSTSLPYDVIILIETWLNEDFYNAEIFDNNFYNVFRKDRCKEITGMKRGGGVLIATKANFSVNQCINSESPDEHFPK